ncbi:tripartite tricarboxylate transporter TctB family protein [Puniceibacterium confluentis]|uniref:tripartite tricarboxylate transporter TctB family protein n=1 Tax=Puniceibacterium confluentis TaxID=1958944 RepID=UPI00164955C2|nr:tripartite tricarboxylate transporter TctB family protein [Puniceibacterium confluentis]
MARNSALRSPETLTLITLLVVSVLSLIFMPYLVAAPKVLFGRALSAIAPSLFPGIVLALMAVMCAGALLLIRAGTVAEPSVGMIRAEWMRALTLFGIMTLYALTMVPFGFLISTAIATTLISLQMGARSVFQIGAVALIGPVALYLCATKLLAVSLPELNTIEMAYAYFLSPEQVTEAATVVSE